MEPHKFSFEGLEVYEKARALVSDGKHSIAF